MEKHPLPDSARDDGLQGRLSPFIAEADRMAGLGLIPIPCRSDDPKKPLMSWRTLRKAPTLLGLKRLLDDNPNANIGMLTGRGPRPVTVVDIDDRALVDQVIALFGPTPVQVETPSGGLHLWYRYDGELCTCLRSHGLAVDIKGAGGFVVVPPARGAGRPAYRFLEGGFDEVERLPSISSAGRAWLAGRPAAIQRPAPRDGGGGTIEEGRRNKMLFKYGLLSASSCSSVAALITSLQEDNLTFCDTPLPAAEVERIARSVWRYHETGENWARGAGVFQATHDEIELVGGPEAFFLLAFLRLKHGSRKQSFVLALRGMAAHATVPGMGEHRLRKAVKRLLETGLLVRVHQGGARAGDAALYRLAPRLKGGGDSVWWGRRGARITANIT